MGRRVAIVGAALAVLGVALETWSLRYLMGSQAVDQFAWTMRNAVAFGPTLGAVCTMAGTVMLGLALLIRLTDRSPVQGRHRGLLWSGIGLVLLTTLLEVAILAGPVVTAAVTPGAQESLGLVLQAVALARLVGAALLGLWLTGLITSPRPPAPAQREPALAPSRPF
ncbi:hypothetical protein [Ornithinimicrobium faecis]|uniref:DUF2269 domain-containing protein n=1 Tax=Ornithinimicrobium faecis TaxID=2934158 RepID=A0ABY4YPK7_9MICO|nr:MULTISPECIES: hypothetical protein [unclassified Ornithinimicrobium]USQ78200.1 hypothetical protein NF556_11070 [Ornithinimicrobium sp. HY1793]